MDVMVSYVQTLVLLVFLTWLLIPEFGSANITTTNDLRDPETIVSSNSSFKLGFFSPLNSTNRYVGIWYNVKGADEKEVVWVANRENPLKDSFGVLRISEDGNLQLVDRQNKSIWSSNVTANNAVHSVATILDTGNLVLGSNGSNNYFWQSFNDDHPITNTFLPFMNITIEELLHPKPVFTSWKSKSNPSNGHFTLGVKGYEVFEYFIWDGDRPYWRSGPWQDKDKVFLGIAAMFRDPMDRFSLDYYSENIKMFTYTSTIVTGHYVLTSDGIFEHRDWDDGNRKMIPTWKSQQSECDVYGKCGEFGRCNSNHSQICSCLKGFDPKNDQEWSKGNWSSGCARRTPLQCGTKGENDEFWMLKNVKVPDNLIRLEYFDGNLEQFCKRQCFINCSCSAYAFRLGFGCMFWNGSLIDIQDFFDVGVDLFIRLAHSELANSTNQNSQQHQNHKASKMNVILPVMLTIGIASLIVILYCAWRWMYRKNGVTRDISEETSLEKSMLKDGTSKFEFGDLPVFELAKLAVATNHFQEMNKLGRGGFGTVYKGKLEDEQEIAVKRLAKSSSQGVEEFLNEVLVISKLQHRNLVKLLGCCVGEEEKMLVFEYMPNKSLDAFLFDPIHRKLLDWKRRFNIILGICRGLLYLHRDSRLKIIHRDLKASNILLDSNFNPKISDFGMARIFGGNEDQADTKRIVGTYGYMSPEYAMEGRFSEKSDVFSLGVLLLEIVSGRRNTSFKDEESMSLLAHAWKLWNEDEILSLIDPTISVSTFKVEILRCIQLGLLCVQEFPLDRPSTSMIIVSVIENEVSDLPSPTQPGFTLSKKATQNATKQKGEQCSVNRVSHSFLSGR